MKIYLSLLYVCLPFSIAFSQNHDFIWQHGEYYHLEPNFYDHFAVDFNSEPPVAYPVDRELNFYATAASICDSTGNLLFYTNGMSIANHAHETMANGDTINTGYYATI